MPSVHVTRPLLPEAVSETFCDAPAPTVTEGADGDTANVPGVGVDDATVIVTVEDAVCPAASVAVTVIVPEAPGTNPVTV